ncbi:MAG: 4-hydroxy-tetrahydrodipicolinate reductase [Burkholderiales bacterium]|nr:4-hydroxy-tetrahydrodipicolinate reductase [Burkholderiales bacterium]
MRVCIAGSGGRMGRALVEAVIASDVFRLAAALEQTGSPLLGRDAGQFTGNPVGVTIGDDVEKALEAVDVLIDFTRPEGTLRHLDVCRAKGVKAVIGTTGFNDQGKRAIETASKDIAIVFAPNMSVGVNVALKLIELAGQALKEGYDIEIIEAHHRHKADAPSGTALKMGEVVAAASGRSLDDAVYGRHGITGERDAKTIGFSTVRGGDIVGDHTVLFAGAGERIEITHRATSRTNFAIGALRAARFLADKKSGLFDMRDVLGLK